MNRHILPLAILFSAVLYSGVINAQEQERVWGIKGGANISSLSAGSASTYNVIPGFHAGVYGHLFSSRSFVLQPELLFTTKGTKATYCSLPSQEAKFSLRYIETPLVAVFKFAGVFELHMGTYISYLVQAQVNAEGVLGGTSPRLDTGQFNRIDYGLLGGIAFTAGFIQLGARYNYSLNKIAASEEAQYLLGGAKNYTVQAYTALRLHYKKKLMLAPL